MSLVSHDIDTASSDLEIFQSALYDQFWERVGPTIKRFSSKRRIDDLRHYLFTDEYVTQCGLPRNVINAGFTILTGREHASLIYELELINDGIWANRFELNEKGEKVPQDYSRRFYYEYRGAIIGASDELEDTYDVLYRFSDGFLRHISNIPTSGR